jgi:hypothetical protein
MSQKTPYWNAGVGDWVLSQGTSISSKEFYYGPFKTLKETVEFGTKLMGFFQKEMPKDEKTLKVMTPWLWVFHREHNIGTIIWNPETNETEFNPEGSLMELIHFHITERYPLWRSEEDILEAIQNDPEWDM